MAEAELGTDEIIHTNLSAWSEEFLDVAGLVSQLSGHEIKKCSVLDLFPAFDDSLDDSTKAFAAQTRLFVDGLAT